MYQPAFEVAVTLDGLQTAIVGVPDFLIWSNDGYLIRDSKLSRHIDQENHPEILLQVQAYGWLYEQSTHTAVKSLQVHCGTNDIVEVPYDGGIAALTELKRILAIKRRSGQPYEPVGWSKCTGCGFGEPCLDRAEQEHDVALLVGVDQNLAKTLHARGVHTWQELLATFDVQTLSDLKRPWGAGTQRVGKKAEGILRSAKAMEHKQERVIAGHYKRTQSEYGGDWAMAMFIEATETSDESKRQQLMGQILQYNREDLEATWVVLEWLRKKTP
ncbi:MAG: hypothetical protein ACLP00_00635 [Terracidiphilus sp.]